jgi:tetratricopeptide (TPR) repeat protein
MQTLKLASHDLAHASLSFDVAESVDLINATPSLAAGLLIDRIQDSPYRAIRTDYVDAWLQYGNRVSADYSFNFVPSRGVFTVLIGPELTPFVHYGVELDPANFSLESDESQTRFYTTLDVTLEVTDADNTPIYTSDREVFLEFTASQMPHVEKNPIAYLADFPLVAGDYRVSVVLRNRVSQQYTVVEKQLTVPSFALGQPTLSEVMLGHEIERVIEDDAPGAMKAFQLGNIRLNPASGNVFSSGETAHLMLQVLGAAPDQKLEVSFTAPDVAPRSLVIPMSDHPDGLVVESLDTKDLDGASYTLTVQLVDGSGAVLSERSSPFLVSPRTDFARPGVYRRSSFGSHIPGMLALARGNQLLALGRYDQAVAELEKAIRPDNPNLPMAKWQLAAALLETREPAWAKKLLSSLEADYPQQFEVIAGLGFANYQTGNFEDAIRYLEQAMTLRPPETGLLNTLGDAYDHLGNDERARQSFERSLALDPAQPDIQKRLESSSNSRS